MKTSLSFFIYAIHYAIQLLISSSGSHALPAFPGAEGFGANATGGRGGEVVFVTNLNDSGSGSFRDAVENTPGKKIVIFRVGGIIDLENRVSVNYEGTTIAGQTAPGGITLRNAGLRIAASNVIVRGLRLRAGENLSEHEPEERDSIQIVGDGVRDVIIDRCSISWGVDENASTVYEVRNITYQWNIMSEGLKNSVHPKGSHSAGLLIGDDARNISILNNYFVHNNRRNPLLSSVHTAEVINNVIYNWGKDSIQVQDFNETNNRAFVNIIGNYLKPGPSTTNPRALRMRLLPSGSKVFLEDNAYEEDGSIIDPMRKSRLVEIKNAPQPVSAPAFSGSGVRVLSASVAKDLVLAEAGAIWPQRDAIDRRLVQDFFNETGEMIDSPREVGGWPEPPTSEAPVDGDRDGMPDNWELQQGLNPHNGSDNNLDADGDGYTNIEEYINFAIRPQPQRYRLYRSP